MDRGTPTSLAPQLTRGDRDPWDPYRVNAMERPVVVVVVVFVFVFVFVTAAAGAKAEAWFVW